jgi:hypothetical protein
MLPTGCCCCCSVDIFADTGCTRAWLLSASSNSNTRKVLTVRILCSSRSTSQNVDVALIKQRLDVVDETETYDMLCGIVFFISKVTYAYEMCRSYVFIY